MSQKRCHPDDTLDVASNKRSKNSDPRVASPESTSYVHLYVGTGTSQVHFKTHLDAVNQSVYFAEYLQEPLPCSIVLPNGNVDEIRRVLSWLYREEADIDASIPKHVASGRQSWIQEYFLAQKYGIEAWSNAIMDSYCEIVPEPGGGSIQSELDCLDLNALERSNLRNLLNAKFRWRSHWDNLRAECLQWPGNQLLRYHQAAGNQIIKHMELAYTSCDPIKASGLCIWHTHADTKPSRLCSSDGNLSLFLHGWEYHRKRGQKIRQKRIMTSLANKTFDKGNTL